VDREREGDMDKELRVLIHRMTCPDCSSDKIFLDTVKRVFADKDFMESISKPLMEIGNARYLDLRMLKWSSVREDELEG
jgi:hypothetical protein